MNDATCQNVEVVLKVIAQNADMSSLFLQSAMTEFLMANVCVCMQPPVYLCVIGLCN